MKETYQKEVNEFPMVFAFSNKQFEEGMAKLGLTPQDTDKVYKFGGTGGFYRREDAEKLHSIFDRHDKEMQEAIDSDLTGDGFIFDMFNYELGNHEYVITCDVSDALGALGLTVYEVNNNEKLWHGLNKATKAQREWYAVNN